MNRKAFSKDRRNENGAVTLELAVTIPILLMLLFGIIEFGRIFMINNMLCSAAREGARVASLPGASNQAVLEKINQELSSAGLSLDTYTFSPSDVSTATRDEPITVTVQINYGDIALSSGFIPGVSSLTLSGRVVMRKEGFG